MRKTNIDVCLTSKKDKSKVKGEEPEEEDKFIRVPDYEVEAQPAKKETRNPRGSLIREKSRDSGSKLLLRRNNSRLDKSG